MSIPLNNIVKINPRVLPVGNNGNDLFGLMLTQKKSIPTGITTAFANADQVGETFGKDSIEYRLASVYFAGFTDSDRVASTLYMAPYPQQDSSASLIGASMTGVTLEALKSLTGNFTIIIDGNQRNVSGLDLSGVKSFSEAAKDLATALGLDANHVSFNPGTYSFIITSPTTGQASSISYATGELADALRLSQVEGAAQSPVMAATPANILNEVRKGNLAFCSVFLTWEASDDEKMAFAEWANSTADDVCVILSDSSPSALLAGKEESFAELVRAANYEGVVSVYHNLELCAFIAGYPAAWDLTKTDGRFTAAFRRSPLLQANVTKQDDALALKANGYNFYGVWASATSDFTFMMEGRISGDYLWLDSWYCQVWMRRYFQSCFIKTMLAKGQIPYNTEGKGILSTAIKPAIDDFIKFGAIRSGILLSDDQVQSLKQAGLNQSQINNITSVGYYLNIDMANVSPQTRAQRGSPPINFWYTDGQSVQQINMNSIEIQ